MINRLKNALVAAANGVRQFNVNDVPCHVTGFNLSFNLSDAAIVIFGVDFHASLFNEWLVVSFNLGFGVSTTPGNNRQFFCVCNGCTECNRCTNSS